MTHKFDIAVVGAGILGTALAYHLADRGLRVCVLESEASPAMHASGKNAGMVRQLYRHPQLTEWARQSISSWPSSCKAHFVSTGSLILGREVPDHHPELFNQKTVISNGSPVPAVYCATDGLLDSASFVHSLRASGSALGVVYFFQTKVQGLQQSQDTWTLTTDKKSQIEASWIANCAGAWLNDFLAPHLAEARVSASAYARHLFLISNWQSVSMPAYNCGFYWDEVNEWYMRRWDSKSRLVSICDVQAVESPSEFTPNSEISEKLAQRLLKALPHEAQHLHIQRSWHCFRTYTSDQMPLWGEDPEYPRLFWLAAFGGYGMSTGFAAAEDAAASIAGTRSSKYSEFCPARERRLTESQKLVGNSV